MTKTIQILHLEDDPADAELVEETLEAAGLRFEITRTATRGEFEAALRRGDHAIILSDYQLPQYDGMSALHEARNVCPDVPFIFVSGKMGEEAAIRALTEGATDYLLKQNLARLEPAVRRALREASDRRKRRQAEEALRQSETLLRATQRLAKVGGWQWNIEEQTSFWTEETYRIHGLEPQTSTPGSSGHIDRSLECYDPADRPVILAAFERCVRQGEGYDLELPFTSADGCRKWIRTTATAVREGNRIVAVVGTIIDITERKKIEDQLRQAQKLEAVGQLAGGVAHDFNNMLGVIIGQAQLALGNAGLNEPLGKRLKEILAAASRSQEITQQLLAFARKQTIAPKVLDLNNSVEGMLKMLRRLIGEDIELVWQAGGSVGPVKMDPSQIDQILANLCVNARDAISGVGRIAIETRRASLGDRYCREHDEFQPGEYAVLSVSDNGCGMDKNTVNRAFEPFFTTKGLGKGTGLGLATVYGIARQNNGFINVYSEPGHGSTFKVYLPTHASAVSEPPEEDSAPFDLDGDETILVVEDEAAYLETLHLMLEAHGYRVLTASTPSEAILLADSQDKIHLLLTDVIMPEMNGKELAREISSIQPDIIPLFMSGHTDSVIASRGVLDKGVDFIQKPFSKQELATKVRELLNRT